jgi:uncharacterized membrane protein YidH (DUF202 family)
MSGTEPGGPRPAVETDRDPGLQPERTRLAWRRTTLSWAVAGVLAVRQALRADDSAVGGIAVGLAAFGFLGILVLAHRRLTGLDPARPEALPHRWAVAAAACTLLLALCGAALVWWGSTG